MTENINSIVDEWTRVYDVDKDNIDQLKFNYSHIIELKAALNKFIEEKIKEVCDNIQSPEIYYPIETKQDIESILSELELAILGNDKGDRQ